MIDVKELGRGLESELRTLKLGEQPKSEGKIRYFGDGIIKVDGLSTVSYNELLEIEGGWHAIALNLEEDFVGAVLLESDAGIGIGSSVYATGRTVRTKVGEGFLGRIVNPLGAPIDGLGDIQSDKYRPIEFPAPSIMDRDKVNQPLETGILAIDSMIPIGKGQRELIIGDRQTGKTAIAVDAILNQKGKGVYCVYVAVGQKASTLASVINVLKSSGAMEYTTIVYSTAKDSSALQYLAPYSGCALAEEFMYGGKDVLIVYDDLTKHAVAYRTMSLLLKRPAGREAYPGDIFYVHSRLLERAAKLSAKLGGGSMTALPIVETQAGDISAYIPTNVISITDGQIYLESDLFNGGVRPALNVGLSVSRVGGSAQKKNMRAVSGRLRLDLAQYRELAVFSQFGSDLDMSTQTILRKGEKLMETLKQPQYKHYAPEEMILLLVVVTDDVIFKVPLKYISRFNASFLLHIQSNRADIVDKLTKGEMNEQLKAEIIGEARRFIPVFSTQNGISNA